MTLRFKLLVIATLGVVALVLSLHLVSRTVLLEQFEHLEQTETLEDLTRAQKILESESERIQQKVADYAAWDDTYAYIQKPTDAYIRSNFEDATFDILRLNFALIYDRSGKLIFAKGYDFDRKKTVALSPEFFQVIEANHGALLHHKGIDDSVDGLMVLPGRAALVASTPVVTSRREGPIVGTIVFGRYLDAAVVKRMSVIAGVPVDIRSLTDPQLPGDFRRVESQVIHDGTAFVPVSDSVASGYTIQRDIFGKNAFVIKVSINRNIYQHGQSALNRLILLLAGLGIAFGILGAVLIERNVLSRLSRLSREVSQIGVSGNLASRVSKGADDELSSVASAINRMLNDLANAEVRYRAIIEDQSELIARYRPDGTITYANSAYARLWERPADALVGRKIQDLIPYEDEKERFRAHLARIPSIRPEDTAITREISARDKDGTIQWFVWNDRAIFDDQGVVIEIQTSGRNITKRKRAEEALQESEKRYRTVVQDQTELICRYRTDGVLTFVNDAYCRSWNREAADLIGKNLLDIIPDEQGREKFRNYLQVVSKLTPDHSPIINEVKTTFPDGAPRWLHWTDRAIFDGQGNVIEVQAVGRDITAQKQTEIRETIQHAVPAVLAESRTVHGAVDAVLQAVLKHVDWPLGEYWQVDVNERVLSCEATRTANDFKADEFVELSRRITFERGVGLPGRTWADARPHWIRDVLKDGNFPRASAAANIGIHAAFAFPIFRNGKVAGVMEFFSRDICDPDESLLRLFSTIGVQVGQFMDRLEVEANLRASELKYRTLINNIPNVTWRADQHGNTMYISPNVEGVYGFSDQEIIDSKGQLWFGRIFPEHVERVKKAFEELWQGKGIFDVEYKIQRKDGKWIWIHDRSIAIGESDGVRYADGIFSDITERKRLDEERSRLVSILEATSDMVGIATPEGREIYLNRAGRKMLGFGEDENLQGRRIGESHPESIVDFMFREAIPTAIRTGLWQGESIFLSRDGREIPVSQVILSHKNSRGEVEYISTVARDMTEVKKVQEELFRLSSAIENAAEAVVITDLDANIQYVNPAFEEVSGYSRTEVMGKNPRILKSGKLGSEYYRKMWATLTKGETWTGEFINKRKDGALFHEEGSIAPIRTAAGKTLGYVAVKRDVTRQKQMESELRQAQKMDAIGQLAGGVAHDFNNILASIMGYAKLASDGAPAGTELRDDLEQILKAGKRGKELIEQLLAFSRQSGVKGAKTAHQLGEIVRESMKLMRPSLPSSVIIDVKIPENLPFVLIDPIEIHQVIVNLCINASHAMPAGGHLRVELQPRRLTSEDSQNMKDLVTGKSELAPGQYVTLTVEDTGSGIPPEVLPRIFEPFFTTRKKGVGTGMGLAVVYGIVKSHHGVIHVYTEVDKGTTFRIYLPTAQTAEHFYPEKKPKEVKGGTESLLVVDDEEPLAKMIGKTLAKLGYRVTVKFNSMEALKTFQNAPDAFDLVISDQTMPGLTGDKMAEAIRKIRPEMPIILCSGFSEILTPEREKELHVNKLIRKPFMGDELEIEIRKILDEKAKK